MMKPKRITVDIGGKARSMDFDHLMMATAEQVYEKIGGTSIGAGQIISRAVAGQMGATMTLAYSALVSAGEKLSWQTFSKELYPSMEVDVWADMVSCGLLSMFESTDNKAEADSEKN